MDTKKIIYQNSVFYFTIFFFFALWGFWGIYYSRLGMQDTFRNHTHGLLMTLWCVMLVSQAYLIRSGNFKLHKTIGKFSYLLVLLLTIATFNLIHFRLSPARFMVSDILMSTMALMVNGTIAFVILYGLAIYFKHDAMTHARYMMATIFPLFTPITDRLIYGKFRWLVSYAPTIGRYPIVPAFGFLLADILLVLLIIWDWRRNKRFDVFPVALGILLIYHFSVLNFHKFDFWKSFTGWFLSLPLS